MPSARAIPVEQLDRVTGEVIALHESVYAAAQAVGKPAVAGNINKVVNGKAKSACGFGWRYKVHTEDLDGEEWKPYEGVEVSTYGRVRRTTAAGQFVVFDSKPIVTINGKGWPVSKLIAHVFSGQPNGDDVQVPGMDPRYIAGFFDGDGSINISLVGPHDKKGHLLKAEISQCNEEFLQLLNTSLGGAGKVYQDSRRDKYRGETNGTLRFCGKNAKPILDIVARHGIIKAEQARLALNFLDLPRVDAWDAKEQARHVMSALNADKSYDKPLSRVTEPYIAGLFDAEGNVYQTTDNTGKKRMYVKITQKSDPRVLERIAEYLGYGKVSEESRWKIYSRDNITSFHASMRQYLRIKKNALDALVQTLL